MKNNFTLNHPFHKKESDKSAKTTPSFFMKHSHTSVENSEKILSNHADGFGQQGGIPFPGRQLLNGE